MCVWAFPLISALLLIASGGEDYGEGEEYPDDPLEAGVPRDRYEVDDGETDNYREGCADVEDSPGLKDDSSPLQ